MIEATDYIIANKDKLASQAVKYVKSNHPNRTKEPKKCARDIKYMLDAYVSDLNSNTSAKTIYIANNFWKRGQRQVIAHETEIEVHRYIVENIKSNIAKEAADKLDALCNIFCTILNDGPFEDKALDKWQNRYTVRKFDESQPVSDEHVDHLKSMWRFMPTQQSLNDNIWIALTPEYDDLKLWLIKNIYNYPDEDENAVEYMMPVLTSPLTFISMTIRHRDLKKGIDFWEYDQGDANRNIGLHAGIIMEEALSLGYDVATIGCTHAYNDNFDVLQKGFDNKIKEYFDSAIQAHIGVSDYQLKPNLAVCVGKAEPLGPSGEFKIHRGLRYATFQKRPKKWTGII